MPQIIKNKDNGQTDPGKKSTADEQIAKKKPSLVHDFVEMLALIEQKLSVRQKLGGLVCFCIIMGIIPVTLLYQGLFGKEEGSPPFLSPTNISRPIDIPFPDSVKKVLKYDPATPPLAPKQNTDSVIK